MNDPKTKILRLNNLFKLISSSNFYLSKSVNYNRIDKKTVNHDHISESIQKARCLLFNTNLYRIFNNEFVRWFTKSSPNNEVNKPKLDWNDSSNQNSNNNNNRQPTQREKLMFALLLSSSMFIIYQLIKYQEEIQRLKLKMATEEKNKPTSPAGIDIDQYQDQNGNQEGDKSNRSQSGSQLGLKKNSLLITWNEFVTQLLAKGLVSELRTAQNTSLVVIVLKEPIKIDNQMVKYFFMNMPSDDLEAKLERAQEELNLKSEDKVQIVYGNTNFLSGLMQIMVFAFLGFLVYKLTRRVTSSMQNMQTDLFSQFTKAKYTVVDPHLKAGVPKITFQDVAGLHEAKIEVKEFVDYLKEPERFTRLGARVPKGALLLGPPGCGKTLLAKAVAAEASVPFFSMAGTEFIEVIGGVGAARVRNLFEEAKKQSPAIIYIDEIDAVGRKRSDSNQMSGMGELDQTLNQLLVSMDGLESNSNVIILASTNRADILDKALLRPGRFDRHITIDLPTYLERVEILNVHARGLKLDFDGKEKENFVSQLSHLTPRFSGADLANICNEAALLAAREGLKSISKNHFIAALERVMAGAEKKTTTISVEDRKIIAYRECGHVLISWFHGYSDLILKVSLLSRTKGNVFSQYLPSDRKLYSKEELFDQMCLYFGGRVVESVVFNKFTTKSETDLKRITKLAYAQVKSFGMNDVLGNISFPTDQEEKASGAIGKKPYSKKLQSIIDLEVNKLIASAHAEAEKTVRNNLDKLHLLADELIKKENLSYEDIVKLIGPPLNKSRYELAKIAANTSSVA
jgi:spastic paraplegia protein 7